MLQRIAAHQPPWQAVVSGGRAAAGAALVGQGVRQRELQMHSLQPCCSTRCSLAQAPYEKRVLELLKVGKDKRALKVCKRKVRAPVARRPFPGQGGAGPAARAGARRAGLGQGGPGKSVQAVAGQGSQSVQPLKGLWWLAPARSRRNATPPPLALPCPCPCPCPARPFFAW